MTKVKTAPEPSKAKTTAHRSDYRQTNLIQYLEGVLQTSTDIAEKTQAASDLTKLVMALAEHKDRAHERSLRREELQFKRGNIAAQASAVSIDDTIAQLEAEVAAKKEKSRYV